MAVASSVLFPYLISVFLMSQFMKDKKPWDLFVFRVVHNAILCFGSFVMVTAMVTQLIGIYQRGGVESLFCDANQIQLQGDLYFWYYVFFLSKFYEFLDTFVLIARRKPVSFLHCFHHFITAFLCWVGLVNALSIQWITIVLNGSVHVFMYYYYLAQTLGGDVWWKKHLTTGQISQFVLDILGSLLWVYWKFENGSNCSGTNGSLIFMDMVVGSFLILFINFYRQTYKKGTKGE